MTEKTEKPQTYKVGDEIKVTKTQTVIRPDRTEHHVIRGTFVLDEPGTYEVGGESITVSP